ncbi:MAG: tRNA (adenosine(37)-N6)-threonylcarbamoyltransferase complex ATPase subunit type 1 TsaE [Candidatus Omnitrophica bacterium]|nr:tRNA (adenosine(37)-N6)-threonylcarbamoyltransferase complex ATPase subunit type 1 TsaE [Candidatus Omnitrophota bacterium]
MIREFQKASFLSHSVRQTLGWARALGKKLKPGACVALTGSLGSGKTLFIKGLAKGLGVRDSNRVKSPTFVLLHLYEGRVPIYHFDLYRLDREADLDAVGFDEFVQDPSAVSLVEWADKARCRIPSGALWVNLKITGPHSRKISLEDDSGI